MIVVSSLLGAFFSLVRGRGPAAPPAGPLRSEAGEIGN